MTTLALLAWPLLTLILVLRLPFAHAVLISLLGGFLLLPTQGGINLPILPEFTKDTIPALSLLVLGLLLYRTRSGSGHAAQAVQDLPGWLPRSRIVLAGLAMVAFGAQMTSLTNGDRLVYGPTVLPALRVYDALSVTQSAFLMLVPLLLGRKFFAHPDRHRLLLQGLVIAALGLSLLALYEIRMSPQLSRMVYGYFPHSWGQHVRSGGYRPVVFMAHGLQLSMVFAVATIAAFGLFRYARAKDRARYLLAGGWLLATLVLSNSFGALVIAVLVVAVVLFGGVRLQMIFAAAIASTLLFFPLLRSADLVPTDRLVALAGKVDEGRASSLRFRFENEDRLLAHAAERPVFGWGIFGRDRLYTDTGANAVTIDGYWISTLGKSGWFGYLTILGFLALPLLLLTFSRGGGTIHPETAILSLVVAAALIDLIPNGFLSPVALLVVGALWGLWELGQRAASGAAEAPVPALPSGLSYARAAPVGDRLPPEAAEPVPQPRRPAYTRQTTLHHRLRKSD